MAVLDKILPTSLMMRFINNIGIDQNAMRRIIIMQYEQTCKKYIKKAQKKGEEVKVSDLTKAITDNKDFKVLCDRLGLDMAFWEGVAGKLLKEAQYGKEKVH